MLDSGPLVTTELMTTLSLVQLGNLRVINKDIQIYSNAVLVNIYTQSSDAVRNQKTINSNQKYDQ